MLKLSVVRSVNSFSRLENNIVSVGSAHDQKVYDDGDFVFSRDASDLLFLSETHMGHFCPEKTKQKKKTAEQL